MPTTPARLADLDDLDEPLDPEPVDNLATDLGDAPDDPTSSSAPSSSRDTADASGPLGWAPQRLRDAPEGYAETRWVMGDGVLTSAILPASRVARLIKRGTRVVSVRWHDGRVERPARERPAA